MNSNKTEQNKTKTISHTPYKCKEVRYMDQEKHLNLYYILLRDQQEHPMNPVRSQQILQAILSHAPPKPPG